MSTKHLIYRRTHGLLALLLLFTTLLCAAPAAQATQADEPETGWIDLKAIVPEGFKGSVSVLLENKKSGETQIITGYYLNDYVNSVQIPPGEYIVVSAFTSEDSFIYEASTKTEHFTLKDSFVIDVTVTYNPEGEGILANLNKESNEVLETTEPDSESTDIATTETEELPEATDSNAEPEQDVGSAESEGSELPEEKQAEENNGSTIVKTVRNILLTIAATLAFFLGTTLLVVYVRFKFGSD